MVRAILLLNLHGWSVPFDKGGEFERNFHNYQF
jgi:hypothetical protein